VIQPASAEEHWNGIAGTLIALRPAMTHGRVVVMFWFVLAAAIGRRWRVPSAVRRARPAPRPRPQNLASGGAR
jgi:hypothetical protein